MKIKNMLVSFLLLLSPHLFAASSQFLNVESFIVTPDAVDKVLPYAINVASNTKQFNKSSIKYLTEIDSQFIYSTKVKVNKVIYYRLVTGNYATLKQARKHLLRVKKYYPEAWLNVRRTKEIKELTGLLSSPASLKKLGGRILQPVVAPVMIPKVTAKVFSSVTQEVTTEVIPEITPEVASIEVVKKEAGRSIPKKPIIKKISFAEKLLEQARQLFLDRNYARVIAISEKVIEIGLPEQKQRAMEFIGIARERQRKFAQAVAIYTQFLDLYPDSKLTPRIKIRLTGLKTMREDPRARLAENQRRKADENWNIYGSLSQYYRNDIVDREQQDTQEINSSLVLDINFLARRKTHKSSLVIRLDTGMVNDFLDKEDDVRLSRAMLNYTDNESGYQLIGGRQSRTAKGVLGRFDGLVYKGLSHESFSYSVYSGFPVQSSFDSVDSDRQFVGSSINFKPLEKFEMDFYLVHQQIFDLTDRQAVGTEFQYRNDNGFLYGIIDYDLFYSDINNVTAITNYRVTDKLVFNVTYDYRNSPLLTTLNALQGQPVESLEELQKLFNDDEIYQLATDRTSKSQNLFIGSNYQIDVNRQIYLSLSLSSIEETVGSGGVAAAPATEDINFSADYSQKDFFSEGDYTTLGVRLSDTSSAEIISVLGRSRIGGSKSLRYAPRLRLDYRQSKTSEVEQYILKPSFKVTYKPNKKISFEASIGIEYSNFDLPELNDQTQYDLFLGYVYRF